MSIERQEGKFEFTVFRKPTHADQYLHRSSCHPPTVFKGIVNTLKNRAVKTCSSGLDSEIEHIEGSLRNNGYTEKDLRILRIESSNDKEKKDNKNESEKTTSAITYIPKVSEKIKGVLNEIGVRTVFHPPRKLKDILVNKRPEPAKTLGAVYEIPCMTCEDWKYVGESARPIEKRRKEHQRAVREFSETSEVAKHMYEDGHQVDFGGMKIIDKEQNRKKRVIKEALWTQKLNASNKTFHAVGSQWKGLF